MSIGWELNVSRGLPKIELEKQVQKSIVSLGRVKMGQLGSEYLLQKIKSGNHYFSEKELIDKIKTRAYELREQGLHLDGSWLRRSLLIREFRTS